jgi:putative phosphoesterase
MQVGLISDVHANAPALRAVLDDLPPVDRIIHAGDVVGYGGFPRAVIDIFEEHGIESIQGNHDRGVLGEFHDDFHRIPKTAALWTTEHLREDELSFIAELPVETDFFDGHVHVAHGAPGQPNTYTYPVDFDGSLIGDEEVLVLGHTHEQAMQSFEEGTVVNPGSVGLPRDGDPRAAYALLDCESWTVDLHRVEYNIEAAQAAIHENELPDELIEGLEHGELLFGRTKEAAEDT